MHCYLRMLTKDSHSSKSSLYKINVNVNVDDCFFRDQSSSVKCFIDLTKPVYSTGS